MLHLFLLSALVNTNKATFKFYVPHTNKHKEVQSHANNVYTQTNTHKQPTAVFLDQNRYYVLEGIYLVMESAGTHT